MKTKRVPMRMCVGCRQSRPKREMVRIVRTPDGGVEVDHSGKRAGRGAYVCPRPACVEAAARGSRLSRALAHPVPAETIERLKQEVAPAGGGPPGGEP